MTEPAPPPPPIPYPPDPPPPMSRTSARIFLEKTTPPSALNWKTRLLRRSEKMVGEPVTTMTSPNVHCSQDVPDPSPPVPPSVQFWQVRSTFSR